jgi:hypothetical protein
MEQHRKQNELDKLKKRCFIFYDFFYEKYGQSKIYKNAKAGIEIEFEKLNLVVLRHASRDFNNWLREMPIDDAVELGLILKRELGEDINIIEKRRLEKISRILKRGRISDVEDHELLLSHVEDIYDDANKKDELDRSNMMLIDYEKK